VLPHRWLHSHRRTISLGGELAYVSCVVRHRRVNWRIGWASLCSLRRARRNVMNAKFQTRVGRIRCFPHTKYALPIYISTEERFMLSFGIRPSSDHHCCPAPTFFNVHPQHCSPPSYHHEFEGSVYIVLIPLRPPSCQKFQSKLIS
jgi:hypothetical protein